MDNIQKKQGKRIWWLLFVCLFAFSCLALTGCGASQTSHDTTKQKSEQSSRSEIREVSDVPDALSEAMKEVKGCKMTLASDGNSYFSLYEGSKTVGGVELSEDDGSFVVRIDGDITGESSDRALERIAHMTLASVLACNPDYDYEKAQDVSSEIIYADKEYRKGKTSYKMGKESYQYVLYVYL